MPRKIEWTHRLPAAVKLLASLPCPTVDRATIQQLFDVSPRQALRILQRLGAYTAGKCLLLEREDLIRKLAALILDDTIQFEYRRRLRVEDHLKEIRRQDAARRVVIPVPTDVDERRISTLPPGIHLAKGRLQIDFRDTEELLAKLFELAQTIANDYEEFTRVLAAET